MIPKYNSAVRILIALVYVKNAAIISHFVVLLHNSTSTINFRVLEAPRLLMISLSYENLQIWFYLNDTLKFAIEELLIRSVFYASLQFS